MTFGSSKQRTTCAIASVSRILARNWLPSPSPFEAPATSPAISTNSIVAGIERSGLTSPSIASCRGSGIDTTPALGSIVQKGKFSASMPAFVSALNRVDFPTLGKPTMPHLMPMLRLLTNLLLSCRCCVGASSLSRPHRREVAVTRLMTHRLRDQ